MSWPDYEKKNLGTTAVTKVRVQKFIRQHSLIVPKTVVFYKSEIIPCYRKLKYTHVYVTALKFIPEYKSILKRLCLLFHQLLTNFNPLPLVLKLCGRKITEARVQILHVKYAIDCRSDQLVVTQIKHTHTYSLQSVPLLSVGPITYLVTEGYVLR